MPKEGERGRLGQKEGDFGLPRGRNAKEGDEVKKRESPSKRGKVDRYALLSYCPVAVRRILLAQHSAFPSNGLELFESAIASSSILSTGSSSLDKLLDGGLYTSEVTEVAGEIAAGKTQLCLTAAVSACGDSRQSVLYIDTCGGFVAERLAEIAENRYGTQFAEKMLQSIHCLQIFDIYSLMEALEDVRMAIVKKTDCFYRNLRLLIVDSVASVIYPVLGGQQTDGHALMVHLALKLKQLASEFSMAVLVTNNVVRVDGRVNTSLGKTWSHVPHSRLIITNWEDKKDREHSVMLVKSSRQVPSGKTSVIITETGLTDLG
ncbi:hypothetical protein FSP39_010227 [Pinctada imbricata]|uniref:RecA family profile 1 domain-containing protein n=1 Tax=Pinctada imbricata TaxID=66713 RepID=A0AA88XF74_PINIB|nr:hypothetical protein FSP39_010227 [Pinctada imbricata]